VAEVHDRTAAFLDAFIPRVENRFPHKNILLVTHAATAITLVRELVGDRALSFRAGCCVLSTLTRERGDKSVLGKWTPVELGTGHFLTGGVQRDWGFEDVVLVDGEVRTTACKANES